MPHQEAGHHGDVDSGECPPTLRDEPVHVSTVESIEPPQGRQCHRRRGHGHQHRRQFQCRGPGGKSGINRGRDCQPRWCRSGQFGEHPDDGRAQVGIFETAAQVRVAGLGGVFALVLRGSTRRQTHEHGERSGLCGRDLDTLAVAELGARNTGDHHVTVGDVHPLSGDRDEQRIQRGVFAFRWSQAENQSALRWHRPDRLARHRDGQRHRCLRDQGCCDVAQLPALRPVQYCGGLHHR